MNFRVKIRLLAFSSNTCYMASVQLNPVLELFYSDLGKKK